MQSDIYRKVTYVSRFQNPLRKRNAIWTSLACVSSLQNWGMFDWKNNMCNYMLNNKSQIMTSSPWRFFTDVAMTVNEHQLSKTKLSIVNIFVLLVVLVSVIVMFSCAPIGQCRANEPEEWLHHEHFLSWVPTLELQRCHCQQHHYPQCDPHCQGVFHLFQLYVPSHEISEWHLQPLFAFHQ